MKMLTAMLACAVVSGCAAQVISSSERTVMVKGFMRHAAEAQALADAQCAKGGRRARLTQMPTEDRSVYLFDCQL